MTSSYWLGSKSIHTNHNSQVQKLDNDALSSVKCWCQRVSQFCTLILSIGISNHSHFGQKIWDQPSTFISYKGSFTNFKADHINHESLLNDWKVQSEINCVSLEQFTDGKWKQGLFHRDVKLVTIILFRSMLNWSKWYSFIAVLNWSKWYTFIAMLKLVNERHFIIKWFNKEWPKVYPTLICIATHDLDWCCQVNEMILNVPTVGKRSTLQPKPMD